MILTSKRASWYSISLPELSALFRETSRIWSCIALKTSGVVLLALGCWPGLSWETCVRIKNVKRRLTRYSVRAKGFLTYLFFTFRKNKIFEVGFVNKGLCPLVDGTLFAWWFFTDLFSTVAQKCPIRFYKIIFSLKHVILHLKYRNLFRLLKKILYYMQLGPKVARGGTFPFQFVWLNPITFDFLIKFILYISGWRCLSF